MRSQQSLCSFSCCVQLHWRFSVSSHAGPPLVAQVESGFGYDNCLVDDASSVIVGVQATPARLSHESVAARDLIASTVSMNLF